MLMQSDAVGLRVVTKLATMGYVGIRNGVRVFFITKRMVLCFFPTNLNGIVRKLEWHCPERMYKS